MVAPSFDVSQLSTVIAILIDLWFLIVTYMLFFATPLGFWLMTVRSHFYLRARSKVGHLYDLHTLHNWVLLRIALVSITQDFVEFLWFSKHHDCLILMIQLSFKLLRADSQLTHVFHFQVFKHGCYKFLSWTLHLSGSVKVRLYNFSCFFGCFTFLY